MDQIELSNIDVSKLYPFYIIATYLNGLRTCCNVLNLLLIGINAMLKAVARNISELYINNLGYTVLNAQVKASVIAEY